MANEVEVHMMAAIKLPQTVMLPKAVAAQAGSKRQIILYPKKALKLHPSVISFLRTSPQWAHLLEAESTEQPTMVQSTAKAIPERTPRPQSFSGLAEKSAMPPPAAPSSSASAPEDVDADTDDEGAAASADSWNEQMSIAQLRQYASDHGIEILSSDNKKQMVVDKVRAAMPDAEQVED